MRLKGDGDYKTLLLSLVCKYLVAINSNKIGFFPSLMLPGHYHSFTHSLPVISLPARARTDARIEEIVSFILRQSLILKNCGITGWNFGPLSCGAFYCSYDSFTMFSRLALKH